MVTEQSDVLLSESSEGTWS